MAKKSKNNASKTSDNVKVLAITDTGTIITAGLNNAFDYGLIFQHNILYDSKPLPIDLSSNFAHTNLRVGHTLPVKVNKITNIDGKAVAILSIEIGLTNKDDEVVFEQLKVGKKYLLTIYEINEDYITLRFPGTSLRGYIEAKAIKNPEIDKEIELILAKKGNSVFQLMTFEQEIEDADTESLEEKNTDVDSLYQKMFNREASIISEEDEALIKKLLLDYPHTDRYSRYLHDVSHIYCRCLPNALIAFEDFNKLYPKYLEDHNFFISCDLKELTFTIFDSNYVVFKLRADGDYLWLDEFFYGRRDIRAKIICDKNKFNKLIIEGHKIHILDSYNAIPNTFDWRAIMEYTYRMADFHYNTLKKITADFNKKQSIESADFSVLRDLLEFEKNLEKSKGGKAIRINESYQIERTAPLEYNPGTAYNFRLDLSDYNLLCGIMGPDEELFVSLYEANKIDKPVRNGKLFYDEETSIARIEFRKDTEKSLLRNGFLKKRISTEHYDIQIDAISSLYRVKERNFYNSIIPTDFVQPDITKYEDIDFFDEKIKNAIEGNNQPLAVKKALGNKQVLLIQGPPGTGKTSVIIEIIRQLSKEGKKVLVCSQTHAAVRNIIDKLTPFTDELSFIAIENDGEEEAWGSGFDIEEYKNFLINNHIIIQSIKDNDPVDKDFIQKNFQYKSRNGKKYLSYHYYILDYYSESKELYKNASEILAHLLNESDFSGYLLDSYRYQIQDVILGTCIGIGMNRYVRGLHFDTVIIDEAAKANLAESLVPLKLGDRYILVGDDKQLPPYMDRQLISDFVKDYNYSKDASLPALTEADAVRTISKSLFELYHEKMGADSDNIVMLNYQYRMHPEIGNFISNVFYDGMVNMGENTISQFISLPAPYNEIIHFVDTDLKPNNWDKRRGQSYINECEANLICDEIIPLIDKSGVSSDMSLAIITPYSAQRELLRGKLRNTAHANSIYTIDSIQGMEFDIVIFSFVRSFSKKYDRVVGFLDDMRRLNVSLSRAKKKLILLGNKDTLTRPEAHRNADKTIINPLHVFEKLSQSYIQYDSPNKARMFHEKFNMGDNVLCDVIKIENDYLYFSVKGNSEFVFRKPLESYELAQIGQTKEVVMEIVEYTPSLQPIFSIVSYKSNDKFINLKDFDDITARLEVGTMISCCITKKQRVIMASYMGFDCLVPEGAFNEEFKNEFNVGDSILARVYYVDKEKHIITICPVLRSYEESIRTGEINLFFFKLEEKFFPDGLSLTFDNDENAYFSISNKYIWNALLEGDLYCDFQRDWYDEDKISYKIGRVKAFKARHAQGDIVKARVSNIGKFCIAWCEGVAANINNYKGHKIEIGKEYDVMVTYNDKEQVVFNLV